MTLAGGADGIARRAGQHRLRLCASDPREATAALTPFVETTIGRRGFDQETDDNGFERSSVWGELRGGLIFDPGEKLSGELALGCRHDNLDDHTGCPRI